MRFALLIAFLAIVLLGCNWVDPGELSPNQRKQLEDAVKQMLRDPDSARFDWQKVQDPDPGKAHVLQYCFKVNAKNGFGGYTGLQDVYALFTRNGKQPLENIVIGGIGGGENGYVSKLCSEIEDRYTTPPHDSRVTDDQARAGCSILDGKLFCASPGTGMCWEKGHNPWKGEHPARAIDVGTDPASPDYNHLDRCG